MSQQTHGRVTCDLDPERDRCRVHGGWYFYPYSTGCQTIGVLADVALERQSQFARYGTNEDLPDGTGPDAKWLITYVDRGAAQVEVDLRADYQLREALMGEVSWMHLVREEVAEAFAENDPARLREELIQVAALAVSWIEKLDARDT